MKVLLCSIALCLIATSFGDDKKPGEVCKKDDKCLENSKCEVVDMFCSEMKCKCEGENMAKNSKCLKKYGQACTKDDECYSNKCDSSTKKCVCSGATENYSKTKMMCVTGELLGADCSSKGCFANGNLECPSTGDKKCKCTKYYEKEKSDDDLCMKSKKKKYDETCTDNDDCNSNANLICTGTPKKCGCDAMHEKKTVPYTNPMGKTEDVHKCLYKNATMGVKKGETCTSGKFDDTAKFCEKGLSCGTCPGSTNLRCREKSSDPSGAVQITFSLLAAIGCLALRKVLM